MSNVTSSRGTSLTSGTGGVGSGRVGSSSWEGGDNSAASTASLLRSPFLHSKEATPPWIASVKEAPQGGRSFWWWALLGVGIASFLLALLLPFVVVTSRAWRSTESVKYCDTATCRRAAQLYSAIVTNKKRNAAVPEACTDFYTHVCSRWRSKAVIPSYLNHFSFDDWLVMQLEETLKHEISEATRDQDHVVSEMTHIPVRKFEAIYASCLRAEKHFDLQDMKSIAKRFGLKHFPSLNVEGEPEVDLIAGKLARFAGLFPFVSITMRIDPKNSSAAIVALDEPHTTAQPKFVLSTTESTSWLRHSACDALASLYDVQKSRQTDQWDVLCDNIQSLDIDIIQRMRYAQGHRPGAYYEFKEAGVGDLPNSLYWNWMTFLRTVFAHTGRNITNTTRILVGNLQYMTGLANFLQKQSKDVLYNYLGYRVLLMFSPLYQTQEQHVSTLYTRYHMGYHKHAPERWRICLRFADSIMPMASSWIYHQQQKRLFHLKGDQLYSTFMDIYRRLHESIDESYAYSFLTTADARVEAFRKLRAVHLQMFYLNASMSQPLLKLYGTQATKIDIRHPVHGICNMLRHYWDHYFSIMNNDIHLDVGYTGSLFDVYSRYHYDRNTLYVSHGAFYGPTFTRDKQLIIDLVKSGYRVTRGLLKAIDEKGGFLDSKLSRQDWMGYYTRQRLLANQQCVLKQLKKASVDKVGTLASQQTLSEDVLDVAAVTPLYRFYRKMIERKAHPLSDYRLAGLPEVSSAQLFFYSLAESLCDKETSASLRHLIHNGTQSPNQIRVNLAFKNSRYFVESFNCPAGSAMNAGEESCDFWATFRQNF